MACRSSLTVLAAAAAAVACCCAKPVRTILDTDIGTDGDDLWALVFILARPDVYDLRLVQASTFNTTKRAMVVASILDAVGRLDVPVAVGQFTGDQNMPEFPIAANFTLADFVAKGGNVSYGTASMASIMASSTPSDPVLVVEIAPTTSLGAVIRANPSVTRNCLASAMSGSIYRGYGNSSTPSAEYNVREDVAAAQSVYNATWLAPLLTAPLDTTIQMQFMASTPLGTGPYAALLAANATGKLVFASTLMAHYETWYENGGKGYSALLPFSPSTGTDTLYDPQAAWMGGLYAAQYLALAAEVGAEEAARRSRAGAVAPSFPFVTVDQMPIAVTAGGMTAQTPGAQTVVPAVGFPHGFVEDINNIGADIIDSIIAAG
jgi:inosine-uridine nucleoside N-ribohydrolase